VEFQQGLNDLSGQCIRGDESVLEPMTRWKYGFLSEKSNSVLNSENRRILHLIGCRGEISGERHLGSQLRAARKRGGV
jgi:hypothetical protein